MRAAFLVVALLGLLPGAIATLAPGDEWYFVPPDAPPALLLEVRKPQDGAAAEQSHTVDGPARAALPAGRPAFAVEDSPALPRCAARLAPAATGPPA